ncbi:unnamed protein product [Alopecurus aequalis]
MAVPPLGIPPPERLGPPVDYAAKTTTHASVQVTAAVSPSRDVIFEILSWLPAKSLCRCRCVSKEWRALVSDQDFVATHRSRAEPLLVAIYGYGSDKTLVLLRTDGTVVRVVENLGGDSRLRASLGELACISYGYNQSSMLVMDLATGKTLVSCFRPPWEMEYVCFGFGRAVQSGSIKVFRLGIPPRQLHTRTYEVLTLGDSANWRSTELPPTMISHRYGNTSGVTANGALHFLSQDLCNVLSFDLDEEKWRLIRGPQGGMKAVTISELNGVLCMAQRMHHVINLWLLRDSDNNIWIKAYTVPMPGFGFQIPLRLLRVSTELLFCRYDYELKLVLEVYDPRSGQCTEVKTPTRLGDKIGLCSSSLDPRLYGQS